jgi:hypothetical protein
VETGWTLRTRQKRESDRGPNLQQYADLVFSVDLRTACPWCRTPGGGMEYDSRLTLYVPPFVVVTLLGSRLFSVPCGSVRRWTCRGQKIRPQQERTTGPFTPSESHWVATGQAPNSLGVFLSTSRTETFAVASSIPFSFLNGRHSASGPRSPHYSFHLHPSPPNRPLRMTRFAS